MRVLSVLFDCVSARLGTPRPCIPAPWAWMGPPLGLVHTGRSRTQGLWAAPPPRLTLTGELDERSHPYAEAGTRAQHYF